MDAHGDNFLEAKSSLVTALTHLHLLEFESREKSLPRISIKKAELREYVWWIIESIEGMKENKYD